MQIWTLRFVILVCGDICLCILEVAYFSMIFARWGSMEPIRSGVCDVYERLWGLVVTRGFFVC